MDSLYAEKTERIGVEVAQSLMLVRSGSAANEGSSQGILMGSEVIHNSIKLHNLNTNALHLLSIQAVSLGHMKVSQVMQ